MKEKESRIEYRLSAANTQIKRDPRISSTCKPFVLPLMCFHLFPFCEPSSQPTPSHICRRDCFRIQHEFCRSEHPIAEQEISLGNILFPSCNDLPESNERCTSLQSLFIINVTGRKILFEHNNSILYRAFFKQCNLKYRKLMRSLHLSRRKCVAQDGLSSFPLPFRYFSTATY